MLSVQIYNLQFLNFQFDLAFPVIKKSFKKEDGFSKY
jgi:hypothetical protein